MSLYKLVIRPILFLFDPESIHSFVCSMLRVFYLIPGMPVVFRILYSYEDPSLEREVFGLKFKNPVGLAAGFDKDAKLMDPMAGLGFGFIEIGTLTPKPQKGKERPRLFRLKRDQALVNRMGFNNLGVLSALERLRNRKTDIIVGGNIGKNESTPNENAIEDYEYCFEALYNVVDYFVINVSSPNTPGLRDLQNKEPLKRLISRMQKRSEEKGKKKPILIKIAPDLNASELDDIIEISRELKLNGLIATNTTISRENLKTSKIKIEKTGPGGLSGKPLRNSSTNIIKYLRTHLGDDFPIIGVGGIFSPKDVEEKLNAGASLVQIYTGFVYEGPGLQKRINKYLAKLKKS